MAPILLSDIEGPVCVLRLDRCVRAAVGIIGMLACVAGKASAQTDTAHAIRLSEAVRLDGRLTESVWRTAPAITRFTQREPNEGQPAIENAEVRIAYDDDALYVGARMYSRNPADIRALVTRRDQEGISEFVAISLDTYLDRRTAYSFAVTPAGVRIDVFHPTDNDDSDSGYDPVWEARAQIDSLGWTAEMRIPFNQLRFSPRAEQVWGLNVLRRVPARNEDSYWRLIRREETGWASRMGVLVGIRGIAPSHRLEALPYVAGGSRVRADVIPQDPFRRDRVESEARAGADVKVGLGPNLTLDMTLNPDFGQVEADPAVVNLSAFETFFDERRPFFTEGAELLNRRGLFYSRRIGAPPPGRATADFVEPTGNTTILGAAKLTGRLPSKLSIAALGAFTDHEFVRTFDTTSAVFDRVLVAPRSAYFAASAQQEFGRDASTLAAMVTAVNRAVDPGTPLADLVPRSAYTGLVEGRYRWARGMYDVNFWAGATDVRGDSAAILRQQRSPRRYWQRPDDDIEVDPSRREMQGSFFGLGHSKMAGRHWRWDLDYSHESPGFEPNDFGSYGSVDSRFMFGRLVWRETRPAKRYRSYEIGAGSENGWLYDWTRRFNGGFVFGNVTLPNYWEFNSDFFRGARGLSANLTRGGPLMGTASEYGWSVELQSREGARNRWGVELGGGADENGGFRNSLELSFAVRPGPQLELSFDPEWERGRDARQYVVTIAGGPAATFGQRYIFSAVDLTELSGRIRANYTFTPSLSLETYLEPFAASGHFHSFGELTAARARTLRLYGADASSSVSTNPDGSYTVTDGAASFDLDNEDFSIRSLRSNVVLRWEWRLGSTLFLVWQQDRSGDRVYRAARPGDLFDAFNTRGDNFLALKVSYWLALR